MSSTLERRRFLQAIGGAGAAGILGAGEGLAAGEELETTKVRLTSAAGICVAPQYLAGQLLLADGFTEVGFVPAMKGPPGAAMIGRGEADFTSTFAASAIASIDAGDPITVVAGLHRGCYELFARDGIATMGDLGGGRVGVPALRSSPHLYLSVMAAHVGLDPRRDIEWVASADTPPLERFAAGDIDAFLGFPPEPQILRQRGIGRVILDTAIERPWSQYFCCMLLGNRDYVRDHPVATKRVLRAVLMSMDYCAAEPEQAARLLVEGGFEADFELASATMEDVPYDHWREYDAQDTMRFYALRLHEVGMIERTPNQVLEAGTDFRFLEELKRELKA
jgi:NitT/TauT family transport system substrate-binding protein